jgi:hypothetical protein
VNNIIATVAGIGPGRLPTLTTVTQTAPDTFESVVATTYVNGKVGEVSSRAITVKDGVLYNCIGRIVMEGTIKDYSLAVIPGYDADKHAAAKNADDSAFVARYREAQAAAGPPSHEQLAEMRNAFGEGAVVVDVISGRTIQL